jgi:hypothetical protein
MTHQYYIGQNEEGVDVLAVNGSECALNVSATPRVDDEQLKAKPLRHRLNNSLLSGAR